MTYYYAGLSYSPNDLAHHGVKGQKWGVRRYQNEDGSLTKAGEERYYGPGSARRFKRDLNRADAEYAYAVGRARKAQVDDNRLTKKAEKYVNKLTSKSLKKGETFTPNEKQLKKIAKMTEAHNSFEKAKEAAMKDIKDIEAHQWKLMGAAASQGYSVLTKPIMRDVRTPGKIFADAYVYGAIGSTLMASLTYGGADKVFTQGKRFKVKNDGLSRVQL